MLLAQESSPTAPLSSDGGGSGARARQERPDKSDKPLGSRPLVGSFEENALNNRLQPIGTVDGYLAEVRASSGAAHSPEPLRSSVRVSFHAAGNCFPYVAKVHFGQRGYRIPRKGSLQVVLFNPNGRVEKLFFLFYDLLDMPPNSQTFLRQKTIFQPSSCDSNEQVRGGGGSGGSDSSAPVAQHDLLANKRCCLQNLIQLNIVSSKSGRVYLNKELRIFVSKRVDLETAAQLVKQDYELKSVEEMPNNPRYFSR